MNHPISHSVSNLDLSVVVPCFNENPHVETVLSDWLDELRDLKIQFELILINDGSLDGTGRVLDKLRKDNPEVRVIHQLNMGAVRAYRRGIEASKGRHVLTISANGRCEPSDFLQLWEQRTSVEMVLAQRTHRLDSLAQRIFSRLSRKLARSFFQISLEEPGIEFRLFLRRPVMEALSQIPSSWENFFWALTVLSGQVNPSSIAQALVPYRHRLERKSPFQRKSFIKQAWNHLKEALLLKWHLKKSSVVLMRRPSLTT